MVELSSEDHLQSVRGGCWLKVSVRLPSLHRYRGRLTGLIATSTHISQRDRSGKMIFLYILELFPLY
jgi:hypothetical protein